MTAVEQNVDVPLATPALPAVLPSTADSPDFPSIPYPLRIGVVGHRRVGEPAGVKDAVRSLVNVIDARLKDAGNTTPLQWVIISPLARGADRLVAEAVLERQDAILEVIAPMPIPEYRKDFDDPEDLAEFDRFLARADGRIRIATAAGPAPGQRASAYRCAGERVIDSSELVIAIWDGRPGAEGGTAETVAYALRSGRTVLWIDPGNPARSARMLRRAAEHQTPIAHFDENHGAIAVALPQHRPQWSLGFVRLSAFNQQYRTSSRALAARIERTQREIRERAARAGLPSEAVLPAATHIAPLAAKADALAEWYQTWHRRSQRTMYALAAAAVTIAVFHLMVFHSDHKWILLFEIAALIVSIAVLWLSRRYFLHDRWLYSRYLAEQLRMAMYTLPLGCGRARNTTDGGWELPLFAAADCQISHALWRYLRRVEIAHPAPSSAGDVTSLKRFVIDGWIAHQAEWHEKAAHRKHRRAERNHTLLQILFWCIIACIVLYIAFGMPLLKFLAIVLPAWAAAWHGLSTQDEDHRASVRSRELSQRLSQIAARAEHARTAEDLRTQADDAAGVMAAELQDWLVQVSFHPPEPVV